MDMGHKNALIVVLFTLLVLTTSTSYLVYQHQQQIIEEQEDFIEELISASNAGKEEKRDFINVSESASCANIVAVRSDNHLGVIGKVHVVIKEGYGNVLINTYPFVEPNTQYSVREAVKVAENYTNINVSNKDVAIYFDINGTLIGGPSAGAAITAVTIAAIEGKKVRQDVAITGTIEEGGHIGQVGGVFDKAVAAEKNGMKLFLVPEGQKKQTYYEQKIEEREIEIFGIKILIPKVYYIEKEIDIGEYMKGKIEVVEVSTIEDVVANMIL
jgi:predicted S18 family serine protease